MEKVRSKNAGPFWLTIDVFCGDYVTFRQIESGLSTEKVAEVLHQPAERFKHFPMPELNVVKFSIPRPHIQGSRLDRDMHGAQWALLIDAIEIE